MLPRFKTGLISSNVTIGSWATSRSPVSLTLRSSAPASSKLTTITKKLPSLGTDYDKDAGTFSVVKTKEVRYRGSRVKGIPLQNVMIPPGFEDIDDCPIICEKVTATVGQLRLWEASGKITNVNKILSFPTSRRSDVTETQIDEANQDSSLHGKRDGVV
jgi:hypothetical protein